MAAGPAWRWPTWSVYWNAAARLMVEYYQAREDGSACGVRVCRRKLIQLGVKAEELGGASLAALIRSELHIEEGDAEWTS